MTRTMTDVAVRPLRTDDRTAVLNLLTDVMGGGPTGRRSDEFFAWKHERNPFGPSIAFVAEVDGRIVGLHTFMRWRFIRNGRRVEAVRAVDTATHPAYQGRGIFTQLTKAGLTEAAGQVDLVFNTPNEKSLPGYLKLGWSTVGELPVAIRVARAFAFARGLGRVSDRAPSDGSPTVPRVDFPPAAAVLGDRGAVQGLLDAAHQPTDRVRTDRDARYLHWRYVEPSDLDYRVLAHRDRDRLVGLAVGRPRWRGRLAEFTLSEVIVRRGDTATARRLLRAVARCGVDHVATHLGGWPTAERARRRTGYIAVPGQTMTLVARPIDPRGAPVPPIDEWALSLGDLELF